MYDKKVVIIGGGPSGLIAAREAAKRGVKVIVLEEHSEIGVPCHCAGLLSSKGLLEIGIPADTTFIQNSIKGARFFSPSGLSFILKKRETVAYVVDRCRLDKFLAQQAIRAGAEIRLGSRVQSVKRDKMSRQLLVTTDDREILRTKLLVDAEGISMRVTRNLGIRSLKLPCLVPAIQYDLRNVDVQKDYVEIQSGRNFAPGFFAWMIPLSPRAARLGLGCRGVEPRKMLEGYIRKRLCEPKNLASAYCRSGLIVTCGPIEKTFRDNLLVVGDAAGQVKPTTGGGIVLGGICASIAGDVIATAVRKNDFGASLLKRYETEWKRKLGREFRMTLLARKVLNKISDKTLDKLFNTIITENLQEELSEMGDMDFQTPSIMRILGKKEILTILPAVLRALLPFRWEK